jgi:hypothetical protein
VQGRDKEPDIAYVIRIKLAHILNGGYPERKRQLPPTIVTRSEVTVISSPGFYPK